MRKSKQPSWWQLYGIVIGAVILLWWEGRAGLAAPLRQIVQLGIVFLVYGLIAWWIRVNQVALEVNQVAPNQKRREGQIRVRTRLRVVESIGLEVQNGNHRTSVVATPAHIRSSSARKRGMHKSDRPAGPQCPTGQAYQ